MKVKRIEYKDGSVGYEAKGISVKSVNAEVEKEYTLDLEEKDMRDMFRNPKGFEVTRGRLKKRRKLGKKK